MPGERPQHVTGKILELEVGQTGHTSKNVMFLTISVQQYVEESGPATKYNKGDAFHGTEDKQADYRAHDADRDDEFNVDLPTQTDE